MISLKVNNEDQGKRLDVFISEVNKLSRSYVQQLIQSGDVLINGLPSINKYKIKQGDKISINDSKFNLEVPKIELPIIYEDNDCLVINKPVGILSHSKDPMSQEFTVSDFVSQFYSGKSLSNRTGIVHRLDRATSGVMICAKNDDAQKWLQKQFANRKVKKTYKAIIKTGLEPIEAIIDMPIERDPRSPKKFWVNASGRRALTKYKVTKNGPNYSLIILSPETGRTHQLRVHLSQLKHPIVGDELYGGIQAPRLMLHALSLEITAPNKKRIVFESPLPKIFNEYLN